MAKLAMLVLVMALLITAPSGETSTAESHERDASKATKMQSHMHGRMRVLTDVQDYDYGGANSKHDPHRKPGGGH
ncbi:uncharacterized protein [Triticum aestivum]|uniref:uncharacterized protein n=1 Tax=Triticum aestivum TaxID=4565 RepID=UPI001D00F892|nr:uncharacterized protein LOC123097316 [Triticum aestivum]